MDAIKSLIYHLPDEEVIFSPAGFYYDQILPHRSKLTGDIEFAKMSSAKPSILSTIPVPNGRSVDTGDYRNQCLLI